jgi:hypothetical protein
VALQCRLRCKIHASRTPARSHSRAFQQPRRCRQPMELVPMSRRGKGPDGSRPRQPLTVAGPKTIGRANAHDQYRRVRKFRQALHDLDCSRCRRRQRVEHAASFPAEIGLCRRLSRHAKLRGAAAMQTWFRSPYGWSQVGQASSLSSRCGTYLPASRSRPGRRAGGTACSATVMCFPRAPPS